MNKSLLVFGGVLMLGCAQTVIPAEPPVETKEAVEDFPFKTQRVGAVAEEVFVVQPRQGAEILSPLQLKGKAPGYWFFEATAPVDVVDWNGKIFAQGYIQAQGEWMTEELVTFVGTIEFELPTDLYKDHGWVILRRHNASGLPEHDAAVEVPVKFELED